MANKEKNKSNVIYINRNQNTNNKKSTKKSKGKINESKKTTKEIKSIKVKDSKKNKKIVKDKSNNKKNKKIKKVNKRKKIKFNKKTKLSIAVVFLVLISFLGVREVKNLKNNNGKKVVTFSENKEDTNNDNLKSQYDLSDEKNNASKKYNIVVDAGHGGNDKGSIDSTTTIYEKDIALQIAKKVASRLGRESDVNVVMTRTEDKYVGLKERAEIAKRANADALISIHLNAERKFGEANGLETWYRNGATDGSKELASSVQETTVSYIDITNRGILKNSFEILRETTMPAVLVECGFITNVSDMEKIKDQNYQDMLAEGIMQGTLAFLDSKNGKN